MLQHPAAVRAAFGEASDTFLDTVRAVGDEQWDASGALGVWSVRELTAHALRAYITVETYLTGEPSDGDRMIADAAEYYAASLGDPAIHTAVAERGRTGGTQLTDPVGMSEALAQRVLALAASTGDDDPIATPAGRMVFSEYLVTRTVELAVHTLDLQRATGQPESISPATASVVIDILGQMGDAPRIILALTGRRALPPDYNVLA
jgi:uncharacterized protein (TIGR03083 family)